MKQKTHSGAKKRFRVTKNGKVMSKKRNMNHLLEKKSASRKRRLSGTEALDKGPAKRVKRLLNE
jgi:large subunit ribosomal protein L35